MNSKDNIVTSVADYVQKISDLRKSSVSFRDASLSALTFFRGQANSKWGLSPRLYREGLFKKERTLISEFIRIIPDEFKNMTQFDILVKMQHYGLPTRLLDATLNPLIALFFACHDKNYKDLCGSVFAFISMPVNRQEMSTIKSTVKYSFEYSGHTLNVKKFMNDLYNSKYLIDIEPLQRKLEDYVTVLSIPFHAIIPNLNNRRIINQDGAFFLFGMNSKPYVNPNLNKLAPNFLDFSPVEFNSKEDLQKFWGSTNIFYIPPESKKSILEDLESLGISRNKMFPELEYQADYITEQIKNDIVRSTLPITSKTKNN